MDNEQWTVDNGAPLTQGEVHSAVTSPRFRIVLAFAAIYIIWGSTYLAIRFAIESIPPFSMGGVRFLTAGIILYVWARSKGQPRPPRSDWKSAAILGALMVVLGNGILVWTEQYVPSGLAAVMVATGPFWLVLLDWRLSGRRMLQASTMIGLAIGFAGVVFLTLTGSSRSTVEGDNIVILCAALLSVGTLAWAGGSMYARRLDLKISLTMLLGLQMMSGGAMLLLLGASVGEWSGVDFVNVTARSALALLYLILIGTLVAYSAYLWLMRVSEPAKVATHGYVNPVVAVFLGWGLAGEPVTAGVLLATATILAGVAMINARSFKIGGKIWRRFWTPRLTNNPELAMIARTWEGLVPSEKADAYHTYLFKTGVKACEATAGNEGVYVLRREESGNTRFMFISFWDSMESIKRFAGDDPEVARYFPEDEEFLLEMVPNVEHYEVLGK